MTKISSLFAIALIFRAGALSGQSSQPERWVGTWAAAPQPALPGKVLTVQNQTVRLIVHSSVGGQRVRIRISNIYADRPLIIGSAHIARRMTGSVIDTATDRVLSFDGQTKVSIPSGSIGVSDPVTLTVPPLTDLAISLFFPETTVVTTAHSLASQTSYISNAGDFAVQGSLPVARTVRSWPFLSGIDVGSPPRGATVIAFGSSTTDGDGSSLDSNHRYPDVLAARLQRADDALRQLGVINEGIIGNRLLNDSPLEMRLRFGAALGQAGVTRFERDVLSQPGAKYVIVALGINDIVFPGTFTPASAAIQPEDVIAGYRLLIARAHGRGLRVIGTTIPPFENSAFVDPPLRFYTTDKEAIRRRVNEWILGPERLFDGVVDFDAVLRDPTHRSRLLPAYDAGDHIHMNDAGYAASANAIPLSLFRGLSSSQ